MSTPLLPCPRLQLRWVATVPGESTCHYELILPLGQYDCRRREGDTSNEMAISMGTTTSRGAVANHTDSPFRDGAHARWDAAALGGLPAYVISEDGTVHLHEKARAALTPSASDRCGVTEEMVERALTSGPIPNYCNFGHLLKRSGIANGQDWMRAALEAAIGGVDGWVSVKERMPERGETENSWVLAWYPMGRPRLLNWCHSGQPHWRNEQDERCYAEITHWRPLPQPPSPTAAKEKQ